MEPAEEGTPPPEAAPPSTTAASNAEVGSAGSALESQEADVGMELEMQEQGGASPPKSSSEEEEDDDEERGDTLGELAGVRSPRTQAELEKSSAQPAAAPALSDDEQARRRMSIVSGQMADQAAAMAAAVAAHGVVETKPVNKDVVRYPTP
jgi:hypothetical protein